MSGQQIATATFEPIGDGRMRELWKQTESRDGKPPRIHGRNFQQFLDFPNGFGRHFMMPLFDRGVPESVREFVEPCRKLSAKECELTDPITPIFWRQFAGYTLKGSARFAGPCYGNFQYLQNWEFPDPESEEAIVFCPPQWPTKSTAKTVAQQLEFLGELREKYKLPKHWLSGFGSAGMLSNIFLAHFQSSGERVLLDDYWARTDTLTIHGSRLGLSWDGVELGCGHWDDGEHAYDYLGCFALGVEALGH